MSRKKSRINEPPPTKEQYDKLTPAQKLVLLGTEEKKAAFIEALRETYTVWSACKLVGIGSRSTVYAWRESDEAFAKAWDEAMESAVDALEENMYKKALSGKDTVATIFMLKGGRPEKYKDRVATEHTGKNGGPIEIEDSRDRLANALIGLSGKGARSDSKRN